jgi:Tfp pilus assembly protein PilN
VKRDLNLIPRTESESSVNKFILPVVLIVVLYAATAYLAITIPQQRLQAKEGEYSNIQEKVVALEPVEAQYQQLRAQLAEVEAKKQTIEQTKHSDSDAKNILSLIEQSCPEDVLITDINISSDGVTITGTSVNDTLVAEFMVNLRAIELFYATNISSIVPQDVEFEATQQALVEGVEITEIRQFQLALAYTSITSSEETSEEGEG